ncbi:nitroreductase family deazaflavin-dependent oxidoreductase [Oscillochloris sp. ZM17-4]|uniref:nitroreductase family deazaflavin-dependent oxidoreductase n=1 Tax=Oscillochloris sp. ZM17-4 TaxID=2866714 RepID=UPI001C72C520|nr:nitroreductase family deazaflavin-dependent oxidoreductase [Oscillochloris sp. ZM17-4]MBX0328012.1 nitroreductase family deazaflavin-dependent oxidoreductase [Oscillochloris sp. ZM17-4]
MSKGTTRGPSPKGVKRALLRAPIWIYRAGLGWLFGGRFVMIVHRGRKSGAARSTVLEVVDYDPDDDAFFIASGWGEKADWLQNIAKTPDVILYSGARRRPARAERLSVDQATERLLSYAGRHPRTFAALGRMMSGKAVPPTEDGCRSLASSIPLVALRPRG